MSSLVATSLRFGLTSRHHSLIPIVRRSQPVENSGTRSRISGRRRLLHVTTTSLAASICSRAMAGATSTAPPEVNYQYWRLWVSDDGATHVTQSKMSGFDMVGYSKSPQAVRQEGIPEPKKLIFTELPPKFDNPWCAAYLLPDGSVLCLCCVICRLHTITWSLLTCLAQSM